MSRVISSFVVLVCICCVFVDGVQAQTVVELERELAAKRAEVARLEQQLREMEQAKAARSQPRPTYPATSVPPASSFPPPEDEDGVERALERTLVREGALVLPEYSFEIGPQFSWAHWDPIQTPTVSNSFAASLGFRMGLPWQSQVSVGVPYVVNDLRAGGSSSGFGDVGVVFSKELLRETETSPALLGSIGWTSPTSRACCLGPIPYVSGFQGGFTFSKRLDPLVAFASVSYFSSLSRSVAGTMVDPSDVIGTRIGALLAVTPATSLNAGTSITFLTDPSPGDLPVAASDSVLSSVDLGFTTLVAPRTVFSLTGQFGLTGNVPDFRLVTSMPVKF